MYREVENDRTPEITKTNTAKIVFGEAMRDLSNDKNHPHNIINGAVQLVSWLDHNRIDQQYILDVLHTIKMVQISDFKKSNALVTERFYEHSDTLCDDDRRNELCIMRFTELQQLLTKLGISDQIIIESLLQSCIDYGVTISANSSILVSLFLNAVNHSYGLHVYSNSD